MADFLFPIDIDLGQGRAVSGGCTEPIGRRESRRGRPRRAATRPTTLGVLTDIRRLLNRELPTLRQDHQQLRQGQLWAAAQLDGIEELLQHLLGRVSRIERAAGLVEQPQLRRPARTRPLDFG